MNFENLFHICPANLLSGRTARALCVGILVLTIGLIALPVQGQEEEEEDDSFISRPKPRRRDVSSMLRTVLPKELV